MKLEDLFKHIEDEHKPENSDVEDYDDLPSLSDRTAEHGEPYDPRIEDKKEIKKYLDDAMIYGSGFIKIGRRKWYNPFRWIKGLIYQKRINPHNIYR